MERGNNTHETGATLCANERSAYAAPTVVPFEVALERGFVQSDNTIDPIRDREWA